MRAALLSVLCFAILNGTSVFAADSQSQLAGRLFDQKDYRKALVEAERILKFDPKSTYALEIATKSAKNIGRFNEGAAYAARLYLIDQKPNSLFLQACCFYSAERFTDTLKITDLIIEKDPGYGPAYLLKAEIIRMKEGVSKNYVELVREAETSGFANRSFEKDLADAKSTIAKARSNK